MQVLEDTINLPVCGMMLIYLSAMCFEALSAITVKCLFQIRRVTACYIPKVMHEFNSFVSQTSKIDTSTSRSPTIICGTQILLLEASSEFVI